MEEFKELDDIDPGEPLEALKDEDFKELEESMNSSTGSTTRRENPVDVGGPGRIDDEENDIPGEQNGRELDVFAENRPRNSDGEFKGKDDFVFWPLD